MREMATKKRNIMACAWVAYLHTDFTDQSSVLVDLLTPVQFLDLMNNHYITRSKTQSFFLQMQM